MAKNSTFIKLDDTTPDHPKVDGLSNAAFRAWIEALCYCSEYLTDGVISRHRLGRRDGAKVVTELISVGLVEGDGRFGAGGHSRLPRTPNKSPTGC